jgi:N-dimethylarginine dimethylaminohydrolase
MARIVIRPTILELGLHREQYDDLAAALEAEGHHVEIVEPEERRSVPGIEYALDVAVYVYEQGRDIAVEALIAAMARKLWQQGRRGRRGEVHRDGEPTREVDLSSEPEG